MKWIIYDTRSCGFQCSREEWINDEMIYEMDHLWTADMKSSEAMILAVMNAIFAIA